MTRQIACLIILLSETSTAKTSWANIAQRLFIVATYNWYEKSISTYEIEEYQEKAEALDLEAIKKLFNKY